MLADACKGVQERAYFLTVVLDCIELFKHFDDVLVEFVPRYANGVAHKLARTTYSMSSFKEWVTTPPYFIYDVLILDLI